MVDASIRTASAYSSFDAGLLDNSSPFVDFCLEEGFKLLDWPALVRRACSFAPEKTYQRRLPTSAFGPQPSIELDLPVSAFSCRADTNGSRAGRPQLTQTRRSLQRVDRPESGAIEPCVAIATRNPDGDVAWRVTCTRYLLGAAMFVLGRRNRAATTIMLRPLNRLWRHKRQRCARYPRSIRRFSPCRPSSFKY